MDKQETTQKKTLERFEVLIETGTALVFLGLLATLLGFVLPLEKINTSLGEWLAGIWSAAALVMLALIHIYRCLDQSLDYDEGTAQKKLFSGYVIRYAALTAVFILAAVTGFVNPLILCLGYILMMKMAAYLQPSFHKIINKLFLKIK